MSDRPATAAPLSAVTEQQVAEALESVLRGGGAALTSLNGVVEQVESRLGVNLSHKVDFISSQIHRFLIIQAQQQQNYMAQSQSHQLQQQRDQFALNQASPNFYGVVSPNLQQGFVDYGYRAPMQGSPVVVSAPPTTSVANASVAAAKESAPTGKKRRGGPGGLNKLCGVSPVLQTIVGQPTMPRTEIVKQLWAYIRKNNLQDPNNKRKIICNDELRLVFETDCTDMFKMNKLLAKHITALEPSKPTVQKKSKVDVESASRSDDPVPIVIISEALADLFGTDEREMSQAEVLRQMWEYIKVNQLEDPVNSTTILCDAKLQELLGSESISALGIPETLAQRHLFQKS